MMFSTKVVTKSRRNRSGRISTSRDVVGWVRVGGKVKTTSRNQKTYDVCNTPW